MLLHLTTEDWLTSGKAFLILKNKEKGAVPSNACSITCLSTTFPLLTGSIADSIQAYLQLHAILPNEQKGIYCKSHGATDQPLIDKLVLQNCQQQKTNLNVAWINYKKAFECLPRAWIWKHVEMIALVEI